MAITKGSTPTIKIVLSLDEIDRDNLSHVYLTFSQGGSVVDGLNTTFTPGAGHTSGNTISFERELSQTETNALKADIDLECQVDVVEAVTEAGVTQYKRKISKIFSFGICKSLRTGTLT